MADIKAFFFFFFLAIKAKAIGEFCLCGCGCVCGVCVCCVVLLVFSNIASIQIFDFYLILPHFVCQYRDQNTFFPYS